MQTAVFAVCAMIVLTVAFRSGWLVDSAPDVDELANVVDFVRTIALGTRGHLGRVYRLH